MERHLSEWIFKMEKWDRMINRKIILQKQRLKGEGKNGRDVSVYPGKRKTI